MSKRNSIITNTQQTPLRRSPRFLHKQNPPQPQHTNTQNLKSRKCSTKNAFVKKTHLDCPQKDFKKPSKSNNGERNCVNSSTGLRKSPRLNNGVDGLPSLRRSPRFSNQRNEKELPEKTRDDEGKNKNSSDGNSSERIEESCERRIVIGLINGRRGEAGVVERVDRRARRSCVGIEVGERKERDDGGVRSEEIVIKRKRKRKRGEDDNGSVKGWTKEQEAALQRAYFGLKPTPHFWKKVSKMVSGKSAQDCFDKIHVDHKTPPQHQPRSRANRLNSSALNHFSLSASKLLQPIEPKIKKSSCNKPKSQLAQKTVRQLLQKHYHVDQDHEADLFSVLESNISPSTQAYQSNVILSTPKHVQEKQGFLQKCRERSSSGHKKLLSRFSGSCRTALVSPPVLKQVKNKALHEKYIDQLHFREAKRKAASARAEKAFTGKENRRNVHVQKMDVVKAAKNALVSDARDAINQLQHLQADNLSNSSDFDDDAVDSDNDEGDL